MNQPAHNIIHISLLGSTFAVQASRHIQARQIGRSEYQRKRYPRPEQAGEHIQALEDQQRHNEEINDHDKAHKYEGGLQWSSVVEAFEIDKRDTKKEDGCSHCMDDQSIIG